MCPATVAGVALGVSTAMTTSMLELCALLVTSATRPVDLHPSMGPYTALTRRDRDSEASVTLLLEALNQVLLVRASADD